MSHANEARLRAADLRLLVFDRSVHPELYDVIRRMEVLSKHYRAELVITGQSHVIAVRGARETVTQVLAPMGAALPRIGARECIPVRRDACTEVVLTRPDNPAGEAPELRFAASLRATAYPAAEYRQVSARLLGQTAGAERIQAFFDAPVEGDITPFVLLEHRCGPRRIEVTAIHACPAELTIVRVETRVEIG